MPKVLIFDSFAVGHSFKAGTVPHRTHGDSPPPEEHRSALHWRLARRLPSVGRCRQRSAAGEGFAVPFPCCLSGTDRPCGRTPSPRFAAARGDTFRQAASFSGAVSGSSQRNALHRRTERLPAHGNSFGSADVTRRKNFVSLPM